jgi:uncharacterized protein (DUF433 family)
MRRLPRCTVTMKSMSDTHILEAVPLATDRDGVIRVSGTRVPLETVIGAFLDGATPEEIVLGYTTLSLADVYQVVAYYLKNKEKVDSYLERVGVEEKEAGTLVEARWNQVGIRERLLARQRRKQRR